MNFNQKVHYALQLTLVMKKRYKKTSADEFDIETFDLLKLDLINVAIANISVKSLQEILDLLFDIQQSHRLEKLSNPTYKEVRNSLRWLQATGFKQLRRELKD